MITVSPRAARRLGLLFVWVGVTALTSCGSGSPGSDASVAVGVRTISLNGPWQVAEGDLGATPPQRFDRTVPVPGFVDLAEPRFLEVGIPSSRRDAFWYRVEVDVPADAGPIATLRLHKAKYGVEAWMNGISVGTHMGAFTLAEMDVSNEIVRGATNTLTVRVGADKLQVPPTIPTGEDFEKELWLPGIWDDVALAFSGEQRIVRIKVEPRIDSGDAVVFTTVANHRGVPVDIEISQRAEESRSGAPAAQPNVLRVRLDPGETTFSQTISIANARWWSPEDPFLYTMRTQVDAASQLSDVRETRFGMRSVAWRSGDDAGFYLNGELYYLRGSNLSLHRFFQHPQRAALPWDRAWVRQLLSTHPRTLHWNSMRVSIGRLPNFWYDLADELGILLADEFMMWSLARESRAWSIDEMEKEYRAWVQENWNHPSIGWWDASNETSDPKSTMVIERVRGLDPTRQWENGGHNLPQGPDDPIEEHLYALFGLQELAELPDLAGPAPIARVTGFAPGHPYIMNEYNLLWLGSDGLPFRISSGFYEIVPRMNEGPYTPAEYREAYAYVGSVLTEFWRARRIYAGVQHFTYITSSNTTSDNFLDVRSLTLEPRWEKYATDAFAPVAILLDFWREEFDEAEVDVPIVLINDTSTQQPVEVELLAVDTDGNVVQRSAVMRIDVPALGEVDRVVRIEVPQRDRWVLFARSQPLDSDLATVWSRRKIGFAHLGEPIPDPPFATR